uniref:Complement component 6 n=1 Tax=Astyanax mexicanus TaxID=7994 RepID=A0A8B9H503_ASTMX
MDHSSFCPILLFILALVSVTSGCFCDHYPWSSWTFCTKTCGQGSQQRSRNVRYDDHWKKNNCATLCKTHESRMCAVEECPINCQLTDFGPWSECSPCAKKMFRVRSVLTPAQFGGQDCTQSLMEDRSCHPAKKCQIEAVNCKDKFTCDNGTSFIFIFFFSLSFYFYAFFVFLSFYFLYFYILVKCVIYCKFFSCLLVVFSDISLQDSRYFRAHQVIATATFRTKSSDLYLSAPFLEFLNSLPLEYNYPLYRQIFQLFGTHYFASGTLGGQYDLLYQYDHETFLSYVSASGSFVQTSEKSLSTVKGGRSEYAAALAWEKSGAPPDSTVYKDWIKSTIDNPTVINYQLSPLVDLVRGFPCAVTKRRHMARALAEYQASFDSCKCAPCPNSGRPVLSGTECLCLCQTGTYGSNCEKRAKDYTSEAVDGRWNCWSSWTDCDSSLKRYRTRSCSNPAPQRGGKSCEGENRQQEECTISIFQEQNVCINDDDFVTEGDSESELPPGASGCPKPKPPANSYLRINQRQYDYGAHEEFVCFTGFQMEGYQLIRCLQGGTWQEPKGRCIKKTCSRPTVPEDINITPDKKEHSVGHDITLRCADTRKKLQGPRNYVCTSALTWDPPIPPNINCNADVQLFVQDSRCDKGQQHDGSKCVCIPREDCRKYNEDFCVFDPATGSMRMMSFCAFHAGRCHGDKLYFMNDGPCETSEARLDYAKFRASMSEISSVRVPCGSDTCYEWEVCSSCGCITARDCPIKENTYCLNLQWLRRTKKMSLCGMGALKCGGFKFEILNESECESS